MTKKALWTTVPAARKRLEAAAASRQQAKATLLAARRGKAAARALKRRRSRPRAFKRIKPRSNAMAVKMAVYRIAKDGVLARNPRCRCCCDSLATEIHHTRGRAGSLLLDERYWLPLCAHCHRYVHEHIDWARQRNLIAAPGEWNNPS